MQIIQTANTKPNQLGNCLKVSEVAKKLGIGISTVWQKQSEDPAFPQSFSLFEGGNTTRWLESDVDYYILARMQGNA